MVSEFAVSVFVGPGTFARADAYQRQGRVLDLAWSEDHLLLTGHVAGADQQSYAVRVRLRATGAPELVTGYCDCFVGDRCKHVGALLLDAIRSPAAPAASAAAEPAWRRALDPILGADAALAGTILGVEFELQQETLHRPAPGRFRSDGPREPAYTVAVRPVQLGARGRWRRTGISWREVNATFAVHDWNPRHLDVLRELHQLLVESSYQFASETWLALDACRSMALWSVLATAQREGLGLLTGKAQEPLRIDTEPAVAAVDVARTAEGLSLAPLVARGSAESGEAIARPFALLGRPTIGVATWTPPPQGTPVAEVPVALAPFAEPVPVAAQAFLKLAEPIRIPADEEALFLTEHYRRLAGLLPVVSRDGSFATPQRPVVDLVLRLEHGPNAGLVGRWQWRYTVPGAGGDAVARLPFEGDGAKEARDTEQERRVLASLTAAGIGRAAPALVEAASGRLLARFELSGMTTVAFARDALPRLKSLPHVVVEDRGLPVEYRPAAEAPTVSIGTSERRGERDWFDLDIEVRVGDETAPLADVLRALASGDEYLVLPGGVYFPLDGEVFARLRELIAEARELDDRPFDELRISRYQTSIWDELVDLGVVTRQAEQWRQSVAALAGFAETGELTPQALPAGLRAELRPYQQAGYEWLCFLYDNRLGGVLADDMGLGKTVQALALVARAVEHADREGLDRPRFLVVAPTSVVPNWVAEAHKFVPGLRAVAITETVRKSGRPLAATVRGADLVVTSYALARIDADAYRDLTWAGLLLDEAQFVKNRQSTTYQRLRSLAVPFTLAITGTPLENTLMDLWSMLSLTAPGLFPSPKGFAEYYQRPIEREGDTERLEQLRRRIKPLMLRRTKELVASELPPKIEQVLELDLTPKQRAIYDRYLARERQRVLGLIGEFERNRFAIFRALTVLRQVALDAALVDPAHEGVPSSKLELLDELLQDALAEGHRVLVFSQFTRLLGRVRARLDAADIGYAYLDGSTVRRGEAIDRFRNGVADVFLISLKAGGFGLNLAEADYCILLDPWWNPAAEAQAVDRAHRIGQTRNVLVYRLVARDTIEEKVMALKAAKAELFDAVMNDTTAAAGRGITADDVRELLA